MSFSLFEYQSIPYKQWGLSVDHPFIGDLENLNRHTGVELVQLKRHELQATHYVGTIHSAHGTLTILPKIDRGLEDAQAATRNLITMLCYAYDLPLLSTGDSSFKTGQGSWLEILTRLFTRQLYQQLRQGLERVYVTVEERSPAMKGRWLLERQLARQPYIQPVFEVRYDEFLSDTPLNRIFRYAVELLRGMSRLTENQQLLAELHRLLGAVSLPVRIMPEDIEHIQFTRLNERFFPPFQLAKLLLGSMSQVLQRGTMPLTAFVFDMNALFERFVARFLVRHWRQIVAVKKTAPLYLQSQMQGETPLYLAQNAQGVPVFKLIPDLLMRDHRHQVQLIIDTKYKRLETSTAKLEVSQQDLYQMLAYAGRLNCANVLLLYPTNRAEQIEQTFTVINSRVNVAVHTLNLHQSLQDSRVLIEDFRRIFTPYLF